MILAMLLLPLFGSILNGLVLRPVQPKRSGVIASGFAIGSFIFAVLMAIQVCGHDAHAISSVLPWMQIGEVRFNFGFQIDRFSSLMALIVTGIGSLIHIYSIGYMSEEKTPYRYFAYLNLFLFMMLVLISSDNLIGVFMGWEGVGLCSYLLIGYWYQDPEKANAGMKAFLVNRIGDAGFLIGIFLCYSIFGTVVFADLQKIFTDPTHLPWLGVNLIALGLFVGSMGKSAQIPLYVWLPDAMAGPTPVSALIHAATMVTAGIYLTVRCNFIYSFATPVSDFMAWIGIATALLSALIATSQNDIKKILAYSTVSQLGLMFLALGVHAYVAAFFHVLTHAFFKALLFLGSGSIIHALHGEQDIRHMGGLRKELPWTFLTFAIGTAALCGLPPLSGFFSKDLILFSSLTHEKYGMVFWALGSLVSLLTAFYMTRLFVLTFFGKYRGHAHPHESPALMLIPLIVLAVGSVLAGVLELPHEFPMGGFLSHYFEGIIPAFHFGETHFLSEFGAMGVATLGAICSISLGWIIFSRGSNPTLKVFENKFYVDELYGVIIVKPYEILSQLVAKIIDPKIVDGFMLFPAKLSKAGGAVLSFVQMGSVQFYLLIMLLGGLVVLGSMMRVHL